MKYQVMVNGHKHVSKWINEQNDIAQTLKSFTIYKIKIFNNEYTRHSKTQDYTSYVKYNTYEKAKCA